MTTGNGGGGGGGGGTRADRRLREWLEADGLGGFASGTVAGVRTRRYHAWLLISEADGRRFVLVNGAEVTIETGAGSWALSSQVYAGGLIHPDGEHWLQDFVAEPWPTWIFALPDGTRVVQELLARHGHPQVLLRWRLDRVGGRSDGAGDDRVTLRVRPLLSGRDYHALHQENPAFQFQPVAQSAPGELLFRPYPGVPGVAMRPSSNGRYRHQPLWYRRFHYLDEAARGLDSDEDLASPGELEFALHDGPAVLALARADEDRAAGPAHPAGPVEDWGAAVGREEQERRTQFADPLHRAADAYLVARGAGKTIIAGYPWFTDWGRDTFIALRGLCLATGRLDEARAILLSWAEVVSEGMLPNRFPDGGAPPEYNSVDAALWYVVVVLEYLQAAAGEAAPSTGERRRLLEAVEQILTGHVRGTRYRIGVASDGLLAAGQPGVQLTWMDSKIADWVVTPRTGKAVEIQALWLNALWAGVQLGTPSAARWRPLLARGRISFAERFWDPQRRHLFDVVDVDHQPGVVDVSFRPNQILAVGGLPLAVLEGERAAAVVEAVLARLWTPLGLRSLAPGEPGYLSHYGGGVLERDSAYHQGTVWPWLAGPFVEAWLRVRGDTAPHRREAADRFVAPLLAHLDQAGLGHVSEVADAESPQRPGGCPFQAWSVGELLRLRQLVRADRAERPVTVALAG